VDKVLRFVLNRVVATLLALFVIVTITFTIMHTIPGGPFDSEKKVNQVIMDNLNAKYHLNDPLAKQFVDYWKTLLSGDFGPSFRYESQTVNDIIKDGFPVSATLGAVAVTFALLMGLLLGIIASLKQSHWQDYLAMIFATIGISVPSFVMAPLLMYFLGVKFKILPVAMWGSWKQIVMPAFALSLLPMATIARFTRASMLDVLNQDYIKTAKSKGLNQRVIVYRHAMRNALMPVVTYLGPMIAGVFTGSFVVESIFAIPGLGKWFVQSIGNRDYTVILGLTIFYSLFLLIMNLVVDILYSVIDPRIKLASGGE
jgi:oligopeptide transport system permease protein